MQTTCCCWNCCPRYQNLINNVKRHWKRKKERAEYKNVLNALGDLVLPALCQHHQVVAHRKAKCKTSKKLIIYVVRFGIGALVCGSVLAQSHSATYRSLFFNLWCECKMGHKDNKLHNWLYFQEKTNSLRLESECLPKPETFLNHKSRCATHNIICLVLPSEVPNSRSSSRERSCVSCPGEKSDMER